MERREFLQHSALIAGATFVGLPLFKFDPPAHAERLPRGVSSNRERLHGSARGGCARYGTPAELPAVLIR